MQLPPPVVDNMFDALDNGRWSRFVTFFRELVEFLNELPCLDDLQEIRRERLPSGRTRCQTAFENNFKREPGHWYIFNCGGRNEMQFNVGMFGTRGAEPLVAYLRIGVAWNFYGPSRNILESSFGRFRNLINGNQSILNQLSSLVTDNNLEIEYVRRVGKDPLEHVPTREVINWLQQPPDTRDWILIGRLLRRGTDGQTLEDPARLKQVFQSVFCGFKPFWRQTGGSHG